MMDQNVLNYTFFVTDGMTARYLAKPFLFSKESLVTNGEKNFLLFFHITLKTLSSSALQCGAMRKVKAIVNLGKCGNLGKRKTKMISIRSLCYLF